MPRLGPTAILLAFACAAPAGAGDNWPAFHGGALAGVGTGNTLPATWGTDKNVLWKADVSGYGWSSPVVWAGRVYLTSVQSDARPPEPRKGLYISDLNGKLPAGEQRWLAHCLDARTGKVLWRREAFTGKAPGPVHIKNTYASETPVVDARGVYAYFGGVGLFCYDHDGKPLWSRKWRPYKMSFGWGTAASPALHGDQLFLVNDNEERSFVTALDARTGRTLWEVGRDEKSNWS